MAHTPEPRRCRCDLFMQRRSFLISRRARRPAAPPGPGTPGTRRARGPSAARKRQRDRDAERRTPCERECVSSTHRVASLSPGAGRRSAASRLSVSRLGRLEVASPDPGHTAHTAGRCTHCALSMAAPRCMRGGSRYTLSDTVFESWVNCHFCCIGPASPQLL